MIYSTTSLIAVEGSTVQNYRSCRDFIGPRGNQLGGGKMRAILQGVQSNSKYHCLSRGFRPPGCITQCPSLATVYITWISSAFLERTSIYSSTVWRSHWSCMRAFCHTPLELRCLIASVATSSSGYLLELWLCIHILCSEVLTIRVRSTILLKGGYVI